jgi:hypothetical protein
MQQKKKEGPHGGPSSYFDWLDFGLVGGLRRVSSYFLLLITDALLAITLSAYARRAGVYRCVFWSGVASDDASMRAALKDWLTIPAPAPAGRRKARTNKILRRKLIRCVSHESPLGNPL